MEKKEWIIRENGSIAERFTRERELNAEEAVLEGLAENVFRKVRNIMEVPDWGMAHASVGPANIIWSIPIQRIPLKTRFRLVNKMLVPVFGPSSDLEMPMVWQVPVGIRLVFAVQTEVVENYQTVAKNWLFAFNKDQNGYRLPLPNIYDDCAICTGEFKQSYDTAGECVAASLEQFNKSQWNSDLMPALERSQKFFRFRPSDESFETVPVDAADWTTLCEKVSTAVMERIIQ